MESALTMMPPIFSANASCSADLPLAVGPAMRMAVGLCMAVEAGGLAWPPLVQPPRRRLQNRFLDQRGDRAGLMMCHPPPAIDAPEQVGRGQRRPADKFHAKYAGFLACYHHGLVARVDQLLVRIAQNFAVGFQDRLPAEQNRPSGVNARYVVIRPEAAHCREISTRESAVIGRIRGQNCGFVAHAL